MDYAAKFSRIGKKTEPVILGIESSCDETAAVKSLPFHGAPLSARELPEKQSLIICGWCR